MALIKNRTTAMIILVFHLINLCVIVMPLLPAAIGIILNNDRTQVLLVKRKDVPVWVLPGGGIESNESKEEALIREIKEETGITPSILRICAEYSSTNRLASPTTLFLCQINSTSDDGSNPFRLSDETAEIAFFPTSHLPKTLFHLHAHWLKECLASTEQIQRPLTEVSYLALFKHAFLHPWQVIRFAWTRWFKH